MKKFQRLSLPVLAGALLLGGCDLTVPDYNNPSIEDLRNNPTRESVATQATGLLIDSRANIAGANDYVSVTGILGRESYVFDGSEPRYVTVLLTGPLDSGGFLGGGLWTTRYINIRNANILLDILEGDVPGLGEMEKEAIRGFAKTIQALEYLLVINTRDTNGAPIEVDRPVSEGPAPIATKEEVFAHISQLLTEAQAHLQAGGSSFPFPLSSGFEGFDTPVTFLEFNRALEARVNVYRGMYAEALESLEASFLDTALPLDFGVYYSYGTGSGDLQNELVGPTIHAHPSIVENAELQANGELDQRVQNKIVELDTPETARGLATRYDFSIYEDQSSPVPIIRNEELILLRAEANLGLGQYAAAAEDINFIRVNSGGLEPITDLASQSEEEILLELLRQKRYSLLFEGGHSWIDFRRYGMLDLLPTVRPGDVVLEMLPIPRDECLARGLEECSAGS